MILETNYWFWIGTLYLIYLTVSDFRNNMMVDDRYNWFMSGATFTLLTHFDRKLSYIFSLMIITALLILYLKKYKIMGDADISTITWLFFGFGIISLPQLIWFFAIFGIIGLMYGTIKKITIALFTKYVRKIPKNVKTPYYIVILISFFVHNLIFGLY